MAVLAKESGKKPNKFLGFLKQNGKKLLITAGALALVALALFIYDFAYEKINENPAVVARVGSKDITREDLNTAIFARDFKGSITNPNTLSKEDRQAIVAELIEAEIAKQKSAELGITFSESQIEAAAKKAVEEGAFDAFTDEQKTATKNYWENQLYIEAVKNKLLGWKEGEYVLFRFDKYLDYQDGKKIDGTGDQNKIDEQREYAKKLAADLEAKLKAGLISMEEAQSIVLKDPKISAVAFLPTRVNITGYVDKDQFLNDQSYFDPETYQGLKEGIKDVKAGSYSEPVLMTAKVGKEFKEFGYAIVKVTGSGEGTVLSYKTWLADQKAAMGAVNNLQKSSPVRASYKAVRDMVKSIAKACSVAFSGTHRTNLYLQVFYKLPGGGSAVYSGIPVTFRAGSSSTPNGLIVSQGADCSGSWYQYSLGKTTDAAGEIYLNNNTGGSPAVIDCDNTSAANFVLPTDPEQYHALANTSGGHWEVVANTAARSAYLDGTGLGSTVVKMDLGLRGDWANGTQVSKAVMWVPDYVTPSYSFTQSISFENASGTSITAAHPSDTVYVSMTGKNTGSSAIGDLWIHNAIGSNGFDTDPTHIGTFATPFSIREVAGGNPDELSGPYVCAEIVGSCPGITQGAGSWGSGGDGLEYASHSTSTYASSVPAGSTFTAKFWFKIPNDSSLYYKWVSTNSRVYATANRDRTLVNGKLAYVDKLKIIPPEVMVTTSVNPAGAGLVKGGFGGLTGNGVYCNNSNYINCGEDFYQGKSTYLETTADPGYNFVNWTGTSNCPLLNSTDPSPANFTVSGAMTCTANFTPKTATLKSVITPSTAATAIIDGSMAPNPKTYPTNASITGTPTYSNPTSGYVLSTKVCMVGTTNMPKDGATYVSGAKYNTNGSITFSVGSTANVVCTHTFEPTLTVTKNGNGAGTVTGAPVGINCGSTCSDTYPQNTLVTLTATPAASSTFTGWSGAGATNASGQRVVTMSQSYSVTATFTLKTYHLMPTADTGCHILPSNPVAVDHGMSYSSFTATSDPGYTVLGFSIDNGSTTPGTSYTFNNVTADHTIKAKCSLNTVDVIQISPAADTAFPFDATGTPLVVRPVSSAHDPVTIDIQITAVQNPGVLIKEFTWGAYIDTTTGNPNPNYQVQLDFAGAGLQKNVEYWWTAIGTDGYGNYSPARARKFIINPLPKVSCTAQPGEGVAPLSVHFTYTVSNPGAGTEVTTNSGNPGVSDITKGLTGDFYYTYPDPSSETGFTATFRYPGAENGGCTVTVKVNEPGNGGGGEVAP